MVAQIITLQPYIFPENAKEVEQERLMLQVLQKHVLSPQGSVNNKTSGDFRVWVYLYKKDGLTFNVSVLFSLRIYYHLLNPLLQIGPKKTAYEICAELSLKIQKPVHELQLEELVLNNALCRPIHHTEKVKNH